MNISTTNNNTTDTTYYVLLIIIVIIIMIITLILIIQRIRILIKSMIIIIMLIQMILWYVILYCTTVQSHRPRLPPSRLMFCSIDWRLSGRSSSPNVRLRTTGGRPLQEVRRNDIQITQ